MGWTWTELLAMLEGTFAEDIDPLDAFVKKANIKLQAAAYQQEVSKAIKCLESGDSTTIQIIRDAYLLDLPRDFIEERSVRYQTTKMLTQSPMRPRIATYSPGTPSWFYIEGNKIGPYPYVTGTAQFTLRETNADSVDAYATVSAAALTIQILGGAKSGTYAYTLATYATVTALVLAINTAALGVTATAVTGTLDPADLETVGLRYIHGVTQSFFEGTEEDLYLWYFRQCPQYAMTIEHDAGTASTACTCQITKNAVVLVITTGANAGTYTYDFATYPTIQTLYKKINQAGRGFTAYINDTCADGASSYLLEVLAATSIWGATIYLFNNPELPSEMQFSILREFMLGLAREQDRMYRQAEYHFTKAGNAVKEHKATWMNRRKSNQTDTGLDAYGSTIGEIPAVDEVDLPI